MRKVWRVWIAPDQSYCGLNEEAPNTSPKFRAPAVTQNIYRTGHFLLFLCWSPDKGVDGDCTIGGSEFQALRGRVQAPKRLWKRHFSSDSGNFALPVLNFMPYDTFLSKQNLQIPVYREPNKMVQDTARCHEIASYLPLGGRVCSWTLLALRAAHSQNL